MKIPVTGTAVLLASALLFPCYIFAAEEVVPGQGNHAYQIMQRTLANHPNIDTITLYAAVPGKTGDVVVASNHLHFGGSAPRSVRIMLKQRKPRYAMKHGRFQADLPLVDMQGKPSGALVLSLRSSENRAALEQEAASIRDELASRITYEANLVQAAHMDPNVPLASYAQHLVDQTLARHKDVLILAIHATTPKNADPEILASNIGRIGKHADDDDMRVVRDGETNLEVNTKLQRFEVELPLNDVSGVRIGALGVVFPLDATTDQKAKHAEAITIRNEISRRILKPANLVEPWPYDPHYGDDTYAQALVDGTLKAHPDIQVLALHVTPPDSNTNIILASNIGRIGKVADSDDMGVVTTGKPDMAVNAEGDRYEVQLALRDAGGRQIGAVSIVYGYKPGDDKAALAAKAQDIANELAHRIPSAAALFDKGAAAAALSGSMEPLILQGLTSLPGYTGDFDHFSVDIKSNRLFLAAEDHGTLEVFNLNTGAHEKTLNVVDTPHGIFHVPGTNRMIVTDSGRGLSPVLDMSSYKVIGHVDLAPGADSSVYDPSTKHLYIVTGGKDVGMKVSYLNEVDPWSGKLLRKLEFDSDHTEAVRVEQHGKRMFVNVADKNYVAVVDKKTLRVTDRWPINGANTNLCMALDEADGRLFIVTRNPTKMFVLNTGNGKTVATLDVPAIVDGVFYDGARKRVYVPGAVGEVGVYQQIDPDHYKELARVPSAHGAKSGLLIPQLNRLYVAASPGDRVGGAILWYNVEPAPGTN